MSDMPSPPAAGKRRRGVVALLVLNLIVSASALVMALIVLGRQPAPTEQQRSNPTASGTGSLAGSETARKAACDAWTAASNAMVAARQPFLDAPANWNDPANVSGLVQAQASILTQAEYLRQHVPTETPSEVAEPIAEYIAANIDVAALDGQHQEAAVANAAADRTGAAAAKIRAACGAS